MKITSRQQQVIHNMINEELNKVTQSRTEVYRPRRRLDEVGPDPMRVDHATIEDAINAEIADEANLAVSDMMMKFNRKMHKIVADALNAHGMDNGVPLSAADVEDQIEYDDTVNLEDEAAMNIVGLLIDYAVEVAVATKNFIEVQADVPEPDWDENGKQRPRGEEEELPPKRNGGDGWYKGGRF